MKTMLTTSAGFNPFYFEGKIVHALNFYKDGQVLASCRWFGSNNNYRSLSFDFEIKRAIRLNLDRKDAFYMKSTEYSAWGNEYDVYIPADFVNLQDLGRSEGYKSWDIHTTKQTFTVNLHGVRKQLTKVEPSAATNWEGYKYIGVEGDYLEKFECNYIHTYTEERKKCEEIAANINAKSNMNLSYYDVYKIAQVYDLVKK